MNLDTLEPEILSSQALISQKQLLPFKRSDIIRPLMDLKIPGISGESLTRLLYATMYGQYCEKVAQLQSGQCPFCNLNREINPVVCENSLWIAWRNPWPAWYQEPHLVIAYRRHLKHASELNDEDWVMLGRIVKQLTAVSYVIEGGLFAMRFGDPAFSAASEGHLHANIRVPDGSGPAAVTLAWNEEQARMKVRIVCIFEQLRRGASLEELPCEERKLVEPFMKKQ